MALIRGRVVDSGGRPIPHAAVYVISAPGAHPDISQLSEADGSFLLGVSMTGTYVLGARSDPVGSGEATVSVPADREVRVEIVLRTY